VNRPERLYALVTGASRGIGAAIARRLAADGFDLALACRSRRAELDSLVEAAAFGVRTRAAAFDLADRAATAAYVDGLLADWGAPTAVVCAAGLARDGIFAYQDEDDWDAVLAANLGGWRNLLHRFWHITYCRSASRRSRRCRVRRGRIVTIASVSGQTGNPGQVNYSASKGGVIAASKALAREVASRGITVNVVAPGPVRTAMIADLDEERLRAAIPAGRIGEPEDVAGAVSFLCSPDAAYVTGQVIGVNGGLYM